MLHAFSAWNRKRRIFQKHFSKLSLDRLRALAALEYIDDKIIGNAPVNGQTRRRALFDDLLAAYSPDLIFEAGTFVGRTTQYFSDSASDETKIVSCDTQDVFIGRAALRLQNRGIDFRNQGSEDLLPELGAAYPSKRCFFYLDAHWDEHLPLREEIEAIHGFDSAIVAIDDFRVEGQPGFGYDDYSGRGSGALTLEWLGADRLKPFKIWFPSYTPEEDGGGKRGLVVLTLGSRADEVAGQTVLLTPFGADRPEL